MMGPKDTVPRESGVFCPLGSGNLVSVLTPFSESEGLLPAEVGSLVTFLSPGTLVVGDTLTSPDG